MSLCYGCAAQHAVSFEGTSLKVHSLTSLPSMYLACCTSEIRVFSREDGRELAIIDTRPVADPVVACDEGVVAMTAAVCPPFVVCTLSSLVPFTSSERTVMWNADTLEDCDGMGLMCPPQDVNGFYASSLAFCPGGGTVAGAIGASVYVFTTVSGQCVAVLSGWSDVRSVLFCAQPPRWLVATYSDGGFVIWDSARAVYRSAPRRMGCPVSVSEDTRSGALVFRCLDASVFAVAAPSFKTVASLALRTMETPPFTMETDPGPAMVIVTLGQRPKIVTTASEQVVGPPPIPPESILALHCHAATGMWLVGCDTGVYSIDPNAKEMTPVVVWGGEGRESALSVAFSSLDDDSHEVDVVVATTSAISTYRVQSVVGGGVGGGGLDVTLPQRPLPPGYLKTMSPKPPTATINNNTKPVVFHTQIRSSGYAKDKPWSVQQAEKKRASVAKGPKDKMPPQYPGGCVSQPHLDFNAALASRPFHGSAVLCIAQSAECDTIATASADGTCVTFRTGPLRPNVIKRDRPVTSCDFPALGGGGTTKQLVMTTSGDTIHIHSVGRENPLLSIPLEREVRTAKYFYMDKLVVATRANEVVVLQCCIDTDVDELHRGEMRSTSRTATIFKLPQCQSLTSLDVYNTFGSNYIFATGSNKSVFVLDAGADGAVVATYPDAHTRTIHSICLPTSSRYCSDVPHGYLNTFLTAACDGAVKLWDVRVGNCVRTFAQHTNNAVPVGLAMSPCGRYVAVGSEDRCVVVYDYGTASVVSRVTRTRDVVSAMRFHAVRPMLYGGGCDGSLSAFIP